MRRLGAGRADAVDLHDMGQFGIAFGAGGGFEPRGVAAGQSVDSAATAADDVVMVVARRDEGVEAAATLERVTLDDASVVHGAEAPIDRDEVQLVVASGLMNLLSAQGVLRRIQDLEHGQAWRGDPHSLLLHAEDSRFDAITGVLPTASFLMAMALGHIP